MKYTKEQLINIFNKNNKYFTSTYVRNKKCPFNIFLSDRSDGKTFDCKIQAIIDFYCYDYAHIYARRFDTEITPILKQTYFKKLISKYPIIKSMLDFSYDDNGVLAKYKEESDDAYRYIVYFMPISLSGKLKSQIEDERIMFIDFDEYIPLDNRYLKNEMDYCMSLYRTIDRDRDTTQFCFFGNKITGFNPFFDFFNININIDDDKVKYYKENTVAVQVYHSVQLQEERDKSKFAKAVKNTAYDEFFKGAVLNKYNLNIISIKDAKYYMSFKTNLGMGSIWIKDSYYIISTKKFGNNIVVTDSNQLIKDRITINCLSSNFRKLFKQAYHYNLIAYDCDKAYYIFEPILRKISLS